ncbi:MAG: hypothetical protein Q8916_10980 [Bacteroidota bacterium]|nr:hypothetical protein [Bacteroidota bacterium]
MSLSPLLGGLKAQTLARNEGLTRDIPTTSAPAPDVAEYPSYKVACQVTKKNCTFDIYSPKSDKAEVKLMSISGADVCLIHKGALKVGKNSFTVSAKKVTPGIYYVVSKLSNGEQFADKVTISK